MTHAECDLLDGARRLWPGSAEALVAIYQSLKVGGGWLGAGALIKIGLFEPRERPMVARALRRDVERAKPTRSGPKMNRYNAAIAGLDVIDKLIAEST